MPVKGGKIYAELSQNLERMADGIDKRHGDKDFPPSIKNAGLREARKKLEDIRQKYEDVLTEARKAYDNYGGLAKQLGREFKGHKTILEGFYGKQSQTLTDFGLTPWKPTARKGPRKKKE